MDRALRCSEGVAQGVGLQRGQTGSTLSCKVPAPGTSRRFPAFWFCQNPHTPAGIWGQPSLPVHPTLPSSQAGRGWGGFETPEHWVQKPPQTHLCPGERRDPHLSLGRVRGAGAGRSGRAEAERWQQLGLFLDINRHSQESGEEGAGTVLNKAGRAPGVQPNCTGRVARPTGARAVWCQGSPGDVPQGSGAWVRGTGISGYRDMVVLGYQDRGIPQCQAPG